MFSRRAAVALAGACGLLSAACAVHSPQAPALARDLTAERSEAPLQRASAWPRQPGRPAMLQRVRYDPEVDRIIGESPSGVMRLLGEPTLVWRNPPAEVWQYAGAACVLHVFLYQDPADRRYRVSYAEVVKSDRSLLADEDCVGRLLGHATADLG